MHLYPWHSYYYVVAVFLNTVYSRKSPDIEGLGVEYDRDDGEQTAYR